MISVIVPIYKVEPFLRNCIESILKQTYYDLEILLIDDGSPDRCGEICEEYAKIDNRIRVIHTNNQGLSAARNLGLRESRGEYIGFVDSDDWIDPDMYSALYQRLKETGASISECGVIVEFPNRAQKNIVRDSIYKGREKIRALLCNQICIGVWNKLYRKECWTNICYPVGVNFEEIATTHLVLLKAQSISCTPKQLYHYRMRNGSIIHTQSMKSIIVFWNAVLGRYLFLSTHPEFKNDQEIIDILEKEIAKTSVRIWRWVYHIPQKQRDYSFLHDVSNYEKTLFPLLGKRKWGWGLRVGFFFVRSTSQVSFTILHLLEHVYFLLTKTSPPKDLFLL